MNDAVQVDVAVVGAGPAGLAAAIRSRWVKSYRGVPCSTIMFDPAPPGGLARMRSAMLTGPGFHLQGKELVSRLEADRVALNVSVLPVQVDELVHRGMRWHVVAEGNTACVARAVILAPGMRRLCNEAEFFGRGLTLTYNGYDFLPEALHRLVGDTDGRRLLVVGNRKTANLLPLLEPLRQRGAIIEYLLDEVPSSELGQSFGGLVRFGAAQRYLGGSSLQAVQVIDATGLTHTIACDCAFLDYNAFELRPAIRIAVADLQRDERGFVEVDRHGSTNLPGLFAAGDATGVYAMVLKALAEGAMAGFSAYRWVFEQKFGYEPPLFAYAATDRQIDPESLDYPELCDDDTIEVLAPEAALAAAVGLGVPAPVSDVAMRSLRANHGHERADQMVYRLLDSKAVTIQPGARRVRGSAQRQRSM